MTVPDMDIALLVSVAAVLDSRVQIAPKPPARMIAPSMAFAMTMELAIAMLDTSDPIVHFLLANKIATTMEPVSTALASATQALLAQHAKK
jgi:hypothetical protein